MQKLNKTCVVCREKYTYCGGCHSSIKEPVWKNSFCSENCKEIYHAVAGYSGKAFGANEAKVVLDTCDLSKKDNYTTATKKLIKEIYDTATPLVEQEEVVEKTEEEQVEEKVEEFAPAKKENHGQKAYNPNFKPKNKNR